MVSASPLDVRKGYAFPREIVKRICGCAAVPGGREIDLSEADDPPNDSDR
jgi:hypothetical protein